MRKAGILLIVAVLLTGTLFANGAGEEGSKAYPDKVIEFVAPASAGGGTTLSAGWM